MSEAKNRETSIRELGKFGLIDHITRDLKPVNSSTVKGIGDDAAIIDSGKSLTLVSTDMLLEGIHFNLVYTPLKHLGYKTVIRGISDIIAMNGTPGQVLIALGISSRFSTEQIEELYEGINLASSKYNVDIVGGDISSSLTGLTISVTAIGSAIGEDIIKRNGARPNDLICVTGDFGAAYMGLQLLERERKIFENEKITQPDLSGYEYVIGRQLKPEIPVKVLSDLREANIRPTAMIDVTDGLSSDLLHICKLSRCGCRIFSNKIPIDYETNKLSEEFNINSIIPALNGGEDYELLFTIRLDDFKIIEAIDSVKIIGHITDSDSGKFLVDDNGAELAINAQGWK